MARNRRNKQPGRRNRNNRGPGLLGPPIPAVFLAGLPRDCMEQDVREFLSEVNLLEILFRRARGSFTGVALCKVENLEAVDIAIRQHRRKIRGCTVRVKPCEARELRRALERATKVVYTPILKVQGVHSSVKKEDVLDFFGPIDSELSSENVKLDTAGGVAFVTFLNHAQCEAALLLNGTSLKGSPVVLSPSHRQEMEAMISAVVYTPILKVQGVHSSVKKKDILDFFGPINSQLRGKNVKLDTAGGVAFVTFLNHAQCEAAMLLNGTSLKGWPVVLSPSHRQEMEAMISAGMEVATGAIGNAGAAAGGA